MSNKNIILYLIIGFSLIALSISAQESKAAKPEYQKSLITVQKTNAVDYFQLGKWAKEQKLFGPAKQYFNNALELSPDYPEAKEEFSKCINSGLPKNYFDLVKECRKKVGEVEQKCANRLVDLAKYCKANNLIDEQEHCLSEALKYDYNCKLAREMEGKVRIEGFAWITKADADKIRKGLINANGKWISQNETNRLKWDDAYELRSNHYILKTDMPFQKAQDMLKEMEDFYEAFLTLFYGVDGFSLNPNELLIIHCFKNHQEYKQYSPEPKAFGYYQGYNKIVYVWDEQFDAGLTTAKEMLFHESTHQLCRVGTGNAVFSDNMHHFWITEGIALYGESFNSKKGKSFFGKQTVHSSLGKKDIVTGKFIPLEEFVRLLRPEFYSDQKTSADNKYNQATALTFFLIQNESCRLNFLKYIIDIHRSGGEFKDTYFKETLDVKNMDDLQKNWLDFIKTKL